MKSHKKLAALAVVAASAGLLLTSCSVPESGGGGDKKSSAAEKEGGDIGIMSLDGVKSDQKAIDLLPQDIKDKGKISVAMDLNYPPTSFKDAGSEDALGFNADFARLLGKKLDLDVDIKNVGFDTIIPGIDGGRYDLTATNMTPTKERLEKLDMVTYWTAGTSLMVSKGNPDNLNINNTSVCGSAKIAVTKGSSAAEEHIPNIDKKCKAAGKDPVNTVVLPDVQAALTQVNSKRIAGVFIDTPQIAWAELQQPDRFELLKPQYKKPDGDDLVALGLKKNSELTPAVLKAVQDLIGTDEYKESLSRWGLESGAATLDDIRQQ